MLLLRLVAASQLTKSIQQHKAAEFESAEIQSLKSFNRTLNHIKKSLTISFTARIWDIKLSESLVDPLGP